MKRKVMLYLTFLVFFTFLLSNVSAGLNDTQIDDAYNCLQEKTQNCSTSLADNIFTLLSIKECKNEVMQASSNNECWPSGACNVKQTAQALFALKESGSDTSKPEAWLISHTKASTNLQWFLEIESLGASTCSIDYTGHSYQISIGEDRKINSNAGTCLSLAQDNYWLEISPTCQNNEYEISCNKDFTTSTLFKEQTSDTIHVSEEVNSASSGGTTTEQVNSTCFADSNSCSYEGTLWASMVLNSMDYDVSSYIPYLVTMSDDNSRTLPEAFLYVLVGDAYKNDLLLKQKSNKYWETSGDRYYDTAVALLAIGSDDVTEKTNALDWLGDVQESNGCWQTSVKNIGFLLYSISPRESSSGDGGSTTLPDCETAGYFCSSSMTCSEAGGDVLDNYQCGSGLLKCCSKEKQLLTCTSQGGEICSGSEQCVGGVVAQASDSTYAECCVGGACVVPDSGGDSGTTENSCETSNGVCRLSECSGSEESDSTLDCDSPSEICCISTQTSSSSSYLWIWILIVLIVLLFIAIIFRDKLRRFWIYLKTKFRPRSGPSEGRGGPYFPDPMRRMIPRRILPSTASQHRPVPPRRTGEFDEVLKKLKDMSR